jgi:hypothetical protein
VARAKRTDRAEARRRYRATLVENGELVDDELDTEDTEQAVARTARTRPSTAQAPPVRPSIVGAFRSSFRPIDVRADIRALPDITLHSKAIWLPVLLTVISAVAYIALPNQVVTTLLFQYFVFTPPVASIFLAGFLAPRASYLTGLIAGVAGAIALTVAALVTISQLQANQATVPTATVSDVIQAAFVVSPISGVFFGGAAGWYKRFLALANPNRGAARPTRPSDRTRRRDPNDRPLLARRR